VNARSTSMPAGWVRTSLDAFAEVILGQSPPSATYNTDWAGVPFYQGKLEFGLMYPTPRKWCTSPKKTAEQGDVLVSVRAPVGPTNICPEKSCIGRGLAAVRGLGGISTPFILYLMRAQEGPLSGIGTGTTFGAITGNKLRGMEVDMPPLPEQHRIVAKIEELFTRLDAGVEALERIKAQLKRYRQAVLKHAFEGKLTAEWREVHKHELEPASVFLERIKEERHEPAKGNYKHLPPLDTSGLPHLPEGWAWTRLGDILEVIRGASPRPKGDPRYFGGSIPWIMISDISREKGKYISATKDTVTAIGARKSRYLNEGTLILSNSGSVCIPKILAVDGCIHDGFVAFPDMSEQLDIMYLYHCFDYIRPSVTQANRQGVTQVNLNTGIVRRMLIPFPTKAEQNKIVEEIERRFAVADQIERTVDQGLKQAERLRQSILKNAFEGKLVPQDPNDEPAEKLLERIREERARLQAGAKCKKAPRKKTNRQEMRLM
jgi:type I restriction enzyme, S subunit